MKEDAKMKENMNTEPMGTMPQVGAMQQMQATPNTWPVQAYPNSMPTQSNQMGAMPYMMNPIPVVCCPYLMNMLQCPMANGQNVMGMNMMNNPMYSGVSPISANTNPVLGAANNGMNSMPGMGTMPAMNQFYPMGGM